MAEPTYREERQGRSSVKGRGLRAGKIKATKASAASIRQKLGVTAAERRVAEVVVAASKSPKLSFRVTIAGAKGAGKMINARERRKG